VRLAETAFPAIHTVTITDGGRQLLPAAQRLASILGLNPPYWRYAPLLNRARRVLRA